MLWLRDLPGKLENKAWRIKEAAQPRPHRSHATETIQWGYRGPAPHKHAHTEHWALEPHSTSATTATTRINSLLSHILVLFCSFRFRIWRDAPECVNIGGMHGKQGPSIVSFCSGSWALFPTKLRNSYLGSSLNMGRDSGARQLKGNQCP